MDYDPDLRTQLVYWSVDTDVDTPIQIMPPNSRRLVLGLPGQIEDDTFLFGTSFNVGTQYFYRLDGHPHGFVQFTRWQHWDLVTSAIWVQANDATTVRLFELVEIP